MSKKHAVRIFSALFLCIEVHASQALSPAYHSFNDQPKVSSIEDRNLPINQLRRMFKFLQVEEIRVRDSNTKVEVAQAMAQEFLPFVTNVPASAPRPQVMTDDPEFKATPRMPCLFQGGDRFFHSIGPKDFKKYFSNSFNMELSQAQLDAMRIKVALYYLDPQHGLFRPDQKDCQVRGGDIYAFSTCHMKDACTNLCPGLHGNTCTKICMLPCTIPTVTCAGLYDVINNGYQILCALPYVCCNAEWARKWYRRRYESIVLNSLGVQRKSG